jgi:hypothetical protein
MVGTSDVFIAITLALIRLLVACSPAASAATHLLRLPHDLVDGLCKVLDVVGV